MCQENRQKEVALWTGSILSPRKVLFIASSEASTGAVLFVRIPIRGRLDIWEGGFMDTILLIAYLLVV